MGEVEARCLRVNISRSEAYEVYRKEISPKFQIPKSDAGSAPNRCRTVIDVKARYIDEALSHYEQEGRGLSIVIAM